MSLDANGGIEALVYRISTALLVPTLVILAVCFAKTLWHAGEELQQFLRSRRRSADAARALRDLNVDSISGSAPALIAIRNDPSQRVPVRRFAQAAADECGKGDPATFTFRLEHLRSEAEADLERDVNRLRVLVRLGPCLGLAGTLIPLGPGLLALSAGDLATLSAQLVVSFSTTVVGLTVGGFAYFLGTIRAHRADLAAGDIELLSSILIASRSPQPSKQNATP